jgi:prepilin-type processing-associated H-X9-DG protein
MEGGLMRYLAVAVLVAIVLFPASLQAQNAGAEAPKQPAAAPKFDEAKLKRLIAILKENDELYTQLKGSPETPESIEKAKKLQSLERSAEGLANELAGKDPRKQEALLQAIVEAVPGYAKRLESAKEAANLGTCKNHLKIIYVQMQIYCTTFGKNRDYPPHAGVTFWLCLAGKCGEPGLHPAGYAAKAPLAKEPGDLKCPTAKAKDSVIDYLGPKKHTPDGTPSALKDSLPGETPIAADKKGNHADGGNVLFFDGSIRFLKGDEYEKALKQLE